MTDYSGVLNRQSLKAPKLGSKKHFDLKKLAGGALMALVVFLVGVYVNQINVISTKGFELRQLDKSIAQLEAKNQKLNWQLVEKQSMAEITKKVEILSMVKNDNIVYLSSTGVAMARK